MNLDFLKENTERKQKYKSHQNSVTWREVVTWDFSSAVNLDCWYAVTCPYMSSHSVLGDCTPYHSLVRLPGQIINDDSGRLAQITMCE